MGSRRDWRQAPRGKRAKDWGLVDDVVSRTKWDETVLARAKALAGRQTVTRGPAVTLPALSPKISDTSFTYKYVELTFDRAARTALAISGTLFSLVGVVVALGGYVSPQGCAGHVVAGVGVGVSGGVVSRRRRAGGWT